MLLVVKEDLLLHLSHTAFVHPKRPVPAISVNKVAGIHCMYQLSELKDNNMTCFQFNTTGAGIAQSV